MDFLSFEFIDEIWYFLNIENVMIIVWFQELHNVNVRFFSLVTVSAYVFVLRYW